MCKDDFKLGLGGSFGVGLCCLLRCQSFGDVSPYAQCRSGSVQCFRLYCLLGFCIARIGHME